MEFFMRHRHRKAYLYQIDPELAGICWWLVSVSRQQDICTCVLVFETLLVAVGSAPVLRLIVTIRYTHNVIVEI